MGVVVVDSGVVFRDISVWVCEMDAMPVAVQCMCDINVTHGQGGHWTWKYLCNYISSTVGRLHEAAEERFPAAVIKFHKLCTFSFGVCILFRSLANTCPWNSVLCQGGQPIQGRSFESLSWEYFAPVWPGRRGEGLCAPPDGRDKEIFKCQVNGGFWTGPLSFFQISTYMLKFNSKTHNS